MKRAHLILLIIATAFVTITVATLGFILANLQCGIQTSCQTSNYLPGLVAAIILIGGGAASATVILQRHRAGDKEAHLAKRLHHKIHTHKPD